MTSKTHPMKVLTILLAAFLFVLPASALVEPAATLDDAATLIDELEKKLDNAEAETVSKLANLKNEEARDGLLALYDKMQSMYMRRAILQGLVLYDDVAGLEFAAMVFFRNTTPRPTGSA